MIEAVSLGTDLSVVLSLSNGVVPRSTEVHGQLIVWDNGGKEKRREDKREGRACSTREGEKE